MPHHRSIYIKLFWLGLCYMHYIMEIRSELPLSFSIMKCSLLPQFPI